jgi:hypothetical protein
MLKCFVCLIWERLFPVREPTGKIASKSGSLTIDFDAGKIYYVIR